MAKLITKTVRNFYFYAKKGVSIDIKEDMAKKGWFVLRKSKPLAVSQKEQLMLVIVHFSAIYLGKRRVRNKYFTDQLVEEYRKRMKSPLKYVLPKKLGEGHDS